MAVLSVIYAEDLFDFWLEAKTRDDHFRENLPPMKNDQIESILQYLEWEVTQDRQGRAVSG
jgi:hypothetical protein